MTTKETSLTVIIWKSINILQRIYFMNFFFGKTDYNDM